MNSDTKTAIVVNMIFRTLTTIFPAFRQAWPSQPDFDEAKKEWVKAFIQAGISDVGQIKYGIDSFRLLRNPFIPSPGQFIALCKPSMESLGIPSVNEAFRIACIASGRNSDKNWVHVSIEHAAIRTGKSDLSSKPEIYTYKTFERHFENSVQDFINGKLPDISKTIVNYSMEGKEIEKQKDIGKEFSKFNSHKKAMSEIFKRLEVIK